MSRADVNVIKHSAAPKPVHPSSSLDAGQLEPWRAQAFGILRIVFGLVWAVDAIFKWQPAFQTGFVTYLTGALDGQPVWVTDWIGFWINIVQVNPRLVRHRRCRWGDSARARADLRCADQPCRARRCAARLWSSGRPRRALEAPTRLAPPISALPSSTCSCSSRCSYRSQGCGWVSTSI